MRSDFMRLFKWRSFKTTIKSIYGFCPRRNSPFFLVTHFIHRQSFVCSTRWFFFCFTRILLNCKKSVKCFTISHLKIIFSTENRFNSCKWFNPVWAFSSISIHKRLSGKFFSFYLLAPTNWTISKRWAWMTEDPFGGETHRRRINFL